jgi:integrase
MMRVLSAAASDEAIRHAIDINSATALTIWRRLDGEGKAVIGLMLLTGLRCKDAQRLRLSQVELPERARGRSRRSTFSSKKIRVQVRVAKNRRNHKKRIILELPLAYRSQYYEVIDYLNEYLAGFEGSNTRPFTLGVSQLNLLLKQVDSRAERKRKVTSYSFRRLYIHELIAILKRDFNKVCDYTLHFEPSTVKSHYDKW